MIWGCKKTTIDQCDNLPTVCENLPKVPNGPCSKDHKGTYWRVRSAMDNENQIKWYLEHYSDYYSSWWKIGVIFKTEKEAVKALRTRINFKEDVIGA